MKKTIREDLEEKYRRAVLVNDNALLIYTESETIENRMDVRLRYVDNNTIKEQYLTHMTRKEFETQREERIEINEQRNAIAMYKIEGDDVILTRLYKIEEHTFAIEEFLDLEYKKWFSNHELSYELKKKRGTKDVKH